MWVNLGGIFVAKERHAQKDIPRLEDLEIHEPHKVGPLPVIKNAFISCKRRVISYHYPSYTNNLFSAIYKL